MTKAFNDLGYLEAKNVVFLHRFPAEQLERFRTLARELVESKSDVIIAITPPRAAVLKETTTPSPSSSLWCQTRSALALLLVWRTPAEI
ncbi:hypothetical protein IVB12_25885 [Bradyrhizobium sp. 179]|uniref:hypothetical protein n=1 Tax=Bradyrhizobium sp. 179 TaxID=2782648 RepID=UPI001FF89645|nr:hypothetical protein [Bradyrhizobium sp. 179]MCK1545277.1 hypothetical protein [Bradyrhizobium sp. 179]